MKRMWLVMLTLAFALLTVSHNVRAQTSGLESQRALVLYHYLSSSTMNEAYGSAYGFALQFSPPTPEEWRAGKLSFSGEVGLIAAGGDPLITDPSWVVNSNELGMVVMPLGLTGLYRLTGDEGGSFSSYVGVGAIGFLGVERMAIDASGGGFGELDWHDTAFRASIAGQATVGLRGRVSGRFFLVAEISWLQGGKGSLKRPSFSEEQIAQGIEHVAEVFQHPDFSFTGLRVGIGVQW